MTKQIEIDAYIKTLLASITVANGYNTNAGDNVYEHLEYTTRPDVRPCIVWVPEEKQSGSDVGPFPAEMGEINHLYPHSWEGYIADDLDGSAGKQLRSDLVKALFSDPRFGGLIEIIDGYRSSAAVETGKETLSIVQVSFNVLYTTPYGSE